MDSPRQGRGSFSVDNDSNLSGSTRPSIAGSQEIFTARAQSQQYHDADGEVEAYEAFEAAKVRAGLGFAAPFSCMLVLANTLLGGSGMLGIPHAVSVAGYSLGLVLLLFFGCASAFGCHLLQCAARKIGKAPCSFYTVAQQVAPRWTWLIDGAVMVKCFGVGTSYLVIVGDLAPDAANFFGLGMRRWHAVSVGFSIAGTLSCLRNLSALRYTAMGSVLIAVWTAVLLGLFYLRLTSNFEPCANPPEPLPCDNQEFKAVGDSDFVTLGKVLPVFIFGFTCQQNIFTICNEVRGASRRCVDCIIVAAYLISGFTFAAGAMLGYATYGDAVASDVLKSYPHSATAVQLTRLLFSVLVVFSYPLQAHPSRTSALALWSLVFGPPSNPTGRERYLGGGDIAAGPSAGRRGDSTRFTVCTGLGLFLSYALAMRVTDLGIILGFVGATGSTMVSYILPGIIYMRAFRLPHRTRLFACLQFGLGCVIMPLCLSFLVL